MFSVYFTVYYLPFSRKASVDVRNFRRNLVPRELFSAFLFDFRFSQPCYYSLGCPTSHTDFRYVLLQNISCEVGKGGRFCIFS